MLSSLTWKTLARKNIKKQNRLVFRLKALFLLKNIFCLYFSPIAKLWPRKKVIFKVFVSWRYSKTLILREGDLLTPLSSFSAVEVVPILLQCLLTLSVLPTTLDNASVSSPITLLGSCSLMSDVFQIWKLKNSPLSTKSRLFYGS